MSREHACYQFYKNAPSTLDRSYQFKISSNLPESKKNAIFCPFWCPHQKKIQVAADRTILTPAAFPIAHLKAYAPRISGNMWKMSVLLKLGVPAPSKVSWSSFVSARKAVFQAVFWRKSSFWLTSTKCWPPLNIHHWKALVKSFHMVFFKNYFMDPAMRQNFGDAHGQIF